MEALIWILIVVGIILIVVGIVVALTNRRNDPPPSTRGSERNSIDTRSTPAAPRIEVALRSGNGYSWSQPSEAKAARQSESCWVPAGQILEVAGRMIPGGMIYSGRRLPSLAGGAEPSLINPSLPVASGKVVPHTADFPYWSSYSELDPRARAVLLDWLASGRRSADAPIGSVFVFFYGLERRVLIDAQHSEAARAEVPEILREVEALLQVYGGEHDSFRNYASRFIDLVAARHRGVPSAEFEPPDRRSGREVPFAVKAYVGTRVAEGRPIPAEWAFSWLITHPEIYLRTPAQRCPVEFRQLFLRRYRETHGDGLKLKRNQTNVQISYRPASSGFRQPVSTSLDIPDVTPLSGPTSRLQKLAESVQDELDRYSRWVGKNDDRDSPAALALLPTDLLLERVRGESEGFGSWLRDVVGTQESVVLSARDLVEHWPSKERGKLSKQEAIALAELMGALGYGLEPDVRFGGINPSRIDHVVVFQGDVTPLAPSASYLGASALLHLGAAVAAADDEVTEDEEKHLEAHLEQGLGIGGAERVRLRAHLRWLLAEPPSFVVLKKKLGSLPEPERHRIGRYLIALAGADGHVSPDELKVLAKIYPLLGLDPSALSADVHDMVVGADQGPVTVFPADTEATDYTIRPRPQTRSEPAVGLDLDLERIAKIRGETAEVASILGNIFAGEDAAPPPVDAGDEAERGDPDSDARGILALPGLDAAHSALVHALATRHHWSRADFSRLAEKHGLMPAGAMEIINDASYAACDEPMLEGDDPIELNTYALEELTV